MAGFILAYPQAMRFTVETNSNAETLRLIDSKRCAAGVMTSSSWASFIASDVGHCHSKTTAGGTLFSVPVAMPISGKFEDFLITIVQGGVGEGLFDTLAAKFGLDFLEPPLCNNSKGVNTDIDGSKKKALSYKEMF